MAARTNTNTNTNTDRNDAAFIEARAALAAKFMAGSATPRRSLTELVSDTLADMATPAAAISAGASASVRNFAIEREAEKQRQALRSADRALRAADRQLRG